MPGPSAAITSSGRVPKLHLHAAEGFSSDSLERAAPAGMNRGDGALLRIGEKNRNAIRGLDDKQDAGLAGKESVALRSFCLRCVHPMHDVGVNLAQRCDMHLVRANGVKELLTVLDHVRARIPFGEAEVQHSAACPWCELACAAGARAEAVGDPAQLRERRRFQDLQAARSAQIPVGALRGEFAP